MHGAFVLVRWLPHCFSSFLHDPSCAFAFAHICLHAPCRAYLAATTPSARYVDGVGQRAAACAAHKIPLANMGLYRYVHNGDRPMMAHPWPVVRSMQLCCILACMPGLGLVGLHCWGWDLEST